jgi:hypothetical protein
MNTEARNESRELEHAKSQLAKATELYLDCDAQNHWDEYRREMQEWQHEVERLEAI